MTRFMVEYIPENPNPILLIVIIMTNTITMITTTITFITSY